MLDDWGNLIGLKAAGRTRSSSTRRTFPTHWALEDTLMVDVDVSEGTPGYRLHGNPMYDGRALSALHDARSRR